MLELLNWDKSKSQADHALELNILKEFMTFLYDNVRVYKERMKRNHEKHIQRQTFEVGYLVLFYNS